MSKDTRGKVANEAIRTEIKQICSETITDEVVKSISDKYFANFESKFDKRLGKLDKLDAIQTKLSDISDRLASMETIVKTNKRALQDINQRCDKIDQFVRNNSIRICGIVENRDEDLLEVVSHFINVTLQTTCSPQDLDSAYRVGKQDNQNDKPRSIIVKLVNNWKKSQILRARKNVRNSGITIFEDLTKQRYELLQCAKQRYGKDKAWSYGGRIFALDKGKKILVTAEDAPM